MINRTFTLQVRNLVFKVRVRSLFNIFGGTVAWLKANRVFDEVSDGRKVDTKSN